MLFKVSLKPSLNPSHFRSALVGHGFLDLLHVWHTIGLRSAPLGWAGFDAWPRQQAPESNFVLDPFLPTPPVTAPLLEVRQHASPPAVREASPRKRWSGRSRTLRRCLDLGWTKVSWHGFQAESKNFTNISRVWRRASIPFLLLQDHATIQGM